MTEFAPADAEVPAKSGRSPESGAGRGLWWIYLMGLVALLVAGSGVGQVAYQFVHPTASVTMANCWTNNGVDMPALSEGDVRSRGQQDAHNFVACARSYLRGVGVSSLAGATALPLTALLLVYADGRRSRRRLVRSGGVGYHSPVLGQARERFNHWCELAGLDGQKRPELLLGGSGRLTARARTTAAPFGRSTVVIPAAYAYGSQQQFDLVVLHELAHVRARDVSWAAATWWTGWLTVFVLLLFLPELWQVNPRSTLYAGELRQAVALTATILLLRAAILRRREREADRYAIMVLASADALAEAVPAIARADRSIRRRGWDALRSAFAVHPAAATRLRQAVAAPSEWEFGLLPPAIVGVLAMFLYQMVSQLLEDLAPAAASSSPWTTDASALVACLFWAVVLVPVWGRAPGSMLRMPHVHGGGVRWPAIAGSALGLTAGFFLRSPGTLELNNRTSYTSHLLLAVLVILLIAFGSSVLAAGLADAAARAPEGRSRGVGEVLRRPATAIAVTSTAIGAGAALATGSFDVLTLLYNPTAAALRSDLITQGELRWTAWVPLILFASAVALSLSAFPDDVPAGFLSRLGLAETRRPLVLVALGGLLLAVLMAQWRFSGGVSTDDEALLLLAQRAWTCAACGVVAAFVVLLAGPATTLAQSIGTGAAVSVLIGLAQFTRDAVTGSGPGSGRNLLNLLYFVRVPSWLFCVILVVTLPFLLLIRDLSRTITKRSLSPAGISLAGLTAVTAAVLVVMTGSVASVTVTAGDARPLPPQPASSSPAQPVVPAPPIASSPSTSDAKALRAGRRLTGSEAGAVLDQVQKQLPSGWAKVANDTSQSKDVRPVTCARLFAHDIADDDAAPKSATLTRTFKLPRSHLPPVGATVIVSLTSYASADIARRQMAVAPAQPKTCPSWNIPLVDGRMHLKWAAPRRLDLPVTNVRQWVAATGSTNGFPFVTENAFGEFIVGRNIASVNVFHLYGGSKMPDNRRTLLQGLRQSVLSDLLAALQR